MVRFAPLNVPLRRRLQTACVTFCFCGTLLGTVIYLALLLWPPATLPMLLYGAWILMDTAPARGSRPSRWWRRFPAWRYFRDYFPVQLIKTAELDPAEGPFVCGYHPHGVLGMGLFATVMTEACGFAEKFPGIEPRVMGLNSVTKIPFARESLIALGVCRVDKESIEYALRLGKQSMATIVVGGAKEALDTVPGTLELTLAHRKGFVKLAIKHGASLVPLLALGENNTFAQFQRPWLRKLQLKLQSVMGFSVPCFYGRGVFNYDLGIIPMRTPINVIMGAPIKTEQMDEPDQEAIDKYHALYVAELRKVFDEHREEYGNGVGELVIK